MVEALGDEFDFLILTSDRDLRSPRSYEGVSSGTWTQIGKARVMYLSKNVLSVLNTCRLLRDLEYDILYLNSFFSRRFSMLPCFLRWVGIIKNTPFVLAPRGEFSQGAIKLKHFRKNIYIYISKLLGVYNQITWHASSEFEKKDILREVGVVGTISMAYPVADAGIIKKYKGKYAENVFIAMDIVSSKLQSLDYRNENKKFGSANFCFLSRISPMKNLDMAIGLLDGLKGDIHYHIYGPIEDKTYWNQCKKRIKTMASNIHIEYKGEVPHEQVEQVFSQCDFFLFPTRGENYGHVIMESLLAGCPVIISDQTPWRNLEASGAGWNLPLDDRDVFRDVLQKCIDMDADEHARHSALAKKYAENQINDPKVLENNRSMFMKVLEYEQ